MILNTGGRTDTVQYYSEWLLNRFREGYVLSRNPLFPEIVNRIELSPETLDVVVFCSKDYSPILPRLYEISNRFNCYYHYTITAYGTDIEPGVPSIEDSIRTLKALAAQVGPEKIAWRYDPVLLTEKYTIERHLETFDRMACELTPYVDRCIFSFVEMYKKLEVNMPELRPVCPGDGDHCPKIRPISPNLRDEGGLRAVRHSPERLHDGGNLLQRAGYPFQENAPSRKPRRMSLHGEQGIGGLQLLPQRLPLLLRQQRPRKGHAELSDPRSEFAAAAGTFAADRYRQAAEAGIFPVEGPQFV